MSFKRSRSDEPAVLVSTLAGSGPADYENEGGGFADSEGQNALFNFPSGIAIDATGNLYVADTHNHRIRKVTPKGEVSTFAGSGKTGYLNGGFADGKGSAARFNLPSGIAIDRAGNLYVADHGNNRIRKVTPKGDVSTLAGSLEGFADGHGSNARFCSPHGIAIDAADNLYVTDMINHCIRKVTLKGKVSTLAGSGKRKYGFADGVRQNARFACPEGIAIDAAGNLYVTDMINHCIRKVTPRGEVSTLAGRANKKCKGGFADGRGSAARFNSPSGITIDAVGNLYVADSDNYRIRKVTPEGEVSTLAGGERGLTDGRGCNAQFFYPSSIAIDAAGNLYVTDRHCIRKVTPEGEVSTFVGDNDRGFADGQGQNARFNYPSGITIAATGNFYVADAWNNRIRKVTPDGEVSTLAGSRVLGFTDGQGSAVRFYEPHGIAIDAVDNLYVADRWNHCIRKVTPEGKVSTLAGGEWGFADGKGRNARFLHPYNITADATGNLYVADTENYRIRKITPKGKVSTLAGSKAGFVDGKGSNARFKRPHGIAIDAMGNLYVTDKHRIRKVSPKGKVSAFVGGKKGFADGKGQNARFFVPAGIAFDAAGNLYVTDLRNNRIRKVTPKGKVSTLAGSKAGFVDGEGSVARFNHPYGIAIDAVGNLYVTDVENNCIRKIEIRRP